MVEVRSSDPLVDMRMMRLPAVWTTNSRPLLIGAAMFGIWATCPGSSRPASGYGLGVDASTAGLIMLPMS